MEGRLYVVGEAQFESLVSLVNYYTRNPLYRHVKLTFPISKDVLKNVAKKYYLDAMVNILLLFIYIYYFLICYIYLKKNSLICKVIRVK